MKKIILLLAFPFVACESQTESRAHMDISGNRMSDSILKLLDSSLAEPSRELKGIGYLYPPLERTH
jgi:hypothetical protein